MKIEKSDEVNSPKGFVWDFLYEPVFVAILTKDFVFMKKIIDILKKHKSPIQFYHLKHEKFYELMVLIFENWDNKNLVSKVKISALNSSRFESSYKDVISIFLTIYMYHTQENKVLYLNKYSEITEKIKYPLFTKDYLLKYFD